MRITNQMMTHNAIQNMSANLETIYRLQEKIASGKRFQQASDDPLNASLSLALKSGLKTMADYKHTAEFANDWMTATELAFQQVHDIATRAINLVTRGLSDTLGSDERAYALGQEMDSLLRQAIDAGNSVHDGKYLFSGYKTGTRPFEMVDENTVTYEGDQGSLQRSLGPGQSLTVNITGDQTLLAFFQTMIDARNALTDNDPVAMDSALDQLQASLRSVTSQTTTNGARLRQVSLAREFLEKSEIEMKSLLSSKEDINLAEGISLLKSQETTYQAVLEVSRRAVSSMSLFDYLR